MVITPHFDDGIICIQFNITPYRSANFSKNLGVRFGVYKEPLSPPGDISRSRTTWLALPSQREKYKV